MTDSPDWTDQTYRTLEELARIAFPPEAGVTADTLKRRARKGQLTVYKPGKAVISNLAHLHEMMQACRTQPKPLSETDVSVSLIAPATKALGRSLTAQELKRRMDARRAEKKA